MVYDFYDESIGEKHPFDKAADKLLKEDQEEIEKEFKQPKEGGTGTYKDSVLVEINGLLLIKTQRRTYFMKDNIHDEQEVKFFYERDEDDGYKLSENQDHKKNKILVNS